MIIILLNFGPLLTLERVKQDTLFSLWLLLSINDDDDFKFGTQLDMASSIRRMIKYLPNRGRSEPRDRLFNF